jgi:tetratricopeptide (TPR) repeat protein
MDEFTQSTIRIPTPDQRVRIFISSTLVELGDERRVLHSAITDLKLHPVMFEAGARPHPPRNLYRDYLEQSHVYVGVFWKSYGWVAPDMSISGLEDEYNLSEGKPRLIYVKDAPDGRDPRLEQLLQRIRDEGTVCYKPFTNAEELVELVKNDVMALLSEHFGLEIQFTHRQEAPPSYLQSLQRELQQRGIIAREQLVIDFKTALRERKRLVVVGDPGTGKTSLLGAVGEELNAIYISLRNKTTQQVCSHLANHLMVRRNQFPRNLPSEEEARTVLQEQLANSTATIFIDDADQNPSVTRALLSLDFFGCQAVFVTRVIQDDLFQGLTRFSVTAFDRDEVELYLQSSGISLPPGEFQNLLSASHGNALYLYYFTQYQLSPLPEGLEDYQRVLWSQLSPTQQEVLCFLALCLAPLKISDLHALMNADQSVSSTVMETKQIIDSASPLIHQAGRSYEFFHPYFEEYIRSVIDDAGLAEHYHQRLGEYASSKGWAVSAAYHFLRAGDPRLKDHLWDGSMGASLRGDWWLAEELLQRQIYFAQEDNDKNTEAHAHYALAENYAALGLFAKAQEEAEEAIDLYVELGDEEWKEVVELFASTLLIEVGQAEKTVEQLNKALEKYRNTGELREAFIQVNLSFAYNRLSRYKEGAEAGRRALEVFTELKDDKGIYTSLLNLAGCVGRLGDYELQRDYALQIIEAADKGQLLRLKAGGLNLLASAQRYLNDPVSAQRSLEECIAICQSLGSIELELLNIGNLGNALRDQKLYDKAERAYVEVLNKARDNNLPRHEGFALEHLARLKFETGAYKESAELGIQALEFHLQFGESMRTADTQYYLARALYKLERKREAAEYYEASGENYEVAYKPDDAAYSYDMAASIWNALEDRELAARCVSKGLRVALSSELPNRAESLLEEALPGQHGEKLDEVYLQTLQLYIRLSSRTFTSFIYSFASYCKKHPAPTKSGYFRQGIEFLIQALESNPSVYTLNALAVAFEQASTDILPAEELYAQIKRVVTLVEHFHYRTLQNGGKLWTVGLAWQHPVIIQIHCIDDDEIVLRVAAALAIIYLANKDKIEEVVNEFGGNLEAGFTLHMLAERTLREQLSLPDTPSDPEEQTPASIIASAIPYDRPQPPASLVLDDNYESIADWAINPSNKAFVWVLMNAFSLLVTHCTHQRYGESESIPRRSREFCEAVLK